MKIVDFKYKKFTFQLPNPLRISTKTISKKDLIIIKIVDDCGFTSWGEVGPLDSFSSETISECEKKLQELSNKKSFEDLNLLKSEVNDLSTTPSLKFGIEQLLFNSGLLDDQISYVFNEIKLNSLIGIDNLDNILEHVKKSLAKGFDTIKLKIGRPNFEDDYYILKSIHKNFKNDISLRLDNNGSWTLKEAVRNLERLEEFGIEYIEQPVLLTRDLIKLAKNNNIEIAPDESLKDYKTTVNIIESGLINYLILKPSIRIGLLDSLRIIKLANELGINVIITSSFETAVARSSLLYLASVVGHNKAHGLNTPLLGSELFRFQGDYTLPSFKFSKSDFKVTSFPDFL